MKNHPIGNSFRLLVLHWLSALVMIALALSSPMLTTAQTDSACTMPFESVSPPLTDLGTTTYTRMDGVETNFTGGLYQDGSNERPPAHEQAGQQIAATILPLNAAGDHDPLEGRVVLVSIGMSNTGQEFGAFQKLARRNPQINPQVTLINGGVGGRTAEYWVDPASDAWDELQRRLDHFSISNEQVQVAWVKLTLVKGGDFPEKASELQDHLTRIMQHLKDFFPNLKIAYLSSRTRSYTYWRGLSPEPVAFETGFAVKWLIEQQIGGDPALNYDPASGNVASPWISWGPYLWADGRNARSDGLQWLAEDMTGDCTHPSGSGKQKVASLLLDFFLNDSTTAWFRAEPSLHSQASPTLDAPSPTPTSPPISYVPATPSPPPATEMANPSSSTPTPEPQPAGDPGQLEPRSSPVRWLFPLGAVAALILTTGIWLLRPKR